MPTVYNRKQEAPYKVYVALLNQTGTDAPVATVLENTLDGVPVWGYVNVANYNATLNGAFPSGKTFVIFQTGSNDLLYRFDCDRSNDNIITILNSEGSDSELINRAIEIRVYP